MSKIFTWEFGFVTGTIGGLLLLCGSMLADPDRFIKLLEYEKDCR